MDAEGLQMEASLADPDSATSKALVVGWRQQLSHESRVQHLQACT